jgi:MYXO-CTERM domain-containing protein
MTKSFSVLVLACCGLWSGSMAMGSSLCTGVSGNLVVNCGFETGDLTGWTVGGDTLNPGGNYYGVDGLDANSGNDGAYMSQDFLDDGIGTVTLSQTLTTGVGSTYTVSFWLEQDSAPTLGYNHAITATFGGSTMLNLVQTIADPGLNGLFTEYTYTESATAASTPLTFAFENDDSYWSFDDVSVTQSAAATPEPATWLLAGVALAGLFLMRRGKTADSGRF